MLKRRLERLERLQRAREKEFIIVFQAAGRIFIQGSGIEFNGLADEGEELLDNLDGNFVIIRFNVPRPGM